MTSHNRVTTEDVEQTIESAYDTAAHVEQYSERQCEIRLRGPEQKDAATHLRNIEDVRVLHSAPSGCGSLRLWIAQQEVEN